MAITFDPAAKRIILDSASASWTEIYSRWVDWAATSDNLKYGMVIRQVGSDDLGSGLSIPPYYFLQGSWRVRPMEADHDLTLTGNGFVEGGGTPVVRTIGAYQVNVNYTVPVQAQGISTSGSTAPTAEQNAAAFMAAIVESGMTVQQALRFYNAVLMGKVSGAGTGTEVFRDINDTKDRVTATVDASGNRTAIVLDAG
jgi:hypothetical protein